MKNKEWDDNLRIIALETAILERKLNLKLDLLMRAQEIYNWLNGKMGFETEFDTLPIKTNGEK